MIEKMTAKEAVEYFVYRDGWLFYRKNSGIRKQDEPAGRMANTGYWHIKRRGRLYAAHRVIWLMHYGEWPKESIDHINGNKTDNRIENLREANASEQARNRKACGVRRYKGVTLHKKTGKYQVCVQMKYIGLFVTQEQAAAAYDAAALRVYGAFARTNAMLRGPTA